MKIFIVLLVLAVDVGSSRQIKKDTCDQLLDVVAVIDGSDSIHADEFDQLKNVMVNFVTNLGVQPNVLHFGSTVYSSGIADVINLSGDEANILTRLSTMPHPQAGTRTDLGIEQMINMFTSNGRTDVPHVGIIITDGASKYRGLTLQQAQQAKDNNNNITLLAVGIGIRIDQSELEAIVSDGFPPHFISRFDDLAQVINSLIKEVCPTTPVPTTTTPVPTTPAPTTPAPTTPAPTTPPSTGSPCDGCKLKNGIGYSARPECDKFNQCFFTDGVNTGFVVQTCSPGTFWDQDKLTCDHIANVNCPNDRCRLEQGLASYTLNVLCHAYVKCVNGHSVAAECERNYAFVQSGSGGQCLPDSTCSGGSGSGSGNKCDFVAVPGNECYYNWHYASGISKMPCPAGTFFNQTSCRCDTKRGNCKRPCAPMVDIDFNSPEPGEYDNYGAVVTNGLAYFDRQSSIKILRLSNVDFQSLIRIQVKFKPDPSQGTTGVEAVVTNGDCGKDSTINILHNSGNSVVFGETDNTDQYNEFTVSSGNSEWRTVDYVVNHDTFKGIVNGNTHTQNVSPYGIKRSQCAFQLGHGEGFQNFIGWIDYIIVSKCL